MDRIVITGLGAISAVGIGKEGLWSGLITGFNGITEVESFDTGAYRTHRGGEVKGFQPPPGTERMGRCSQFAIYAAAEAIADAGLAVSGLTPFRTGICMGTTMWESQLQERIDERIGISGFDEECRGLVPYAVPEALIANLARTFGLRGPANLITTACAAGNYAMGYAANLLRSRTVDVMLAGASDPMSRIAYTGFSSMMAIAPERCQPFDRNRKGMVPGEGCAILVMEREQSARARGARIYGELAGLGISNDAYHMTAPHPEACGAVRAMNRALAAARIPATEVDYISAHGTGTAANDKVETLAVKRVFANRASDVPMSSIKSMLGHTMSAASALEAVACLMAMERGVVPPTINYEERDPDCDLDYIPNYAREMRVDIALSNAYAIGGHCSSAVFRRIE